MSDRFSILPHKRLVILESPYAGDIARNVAYAKRALLHSVRLGEAPIASHLLLPQVLADADAEERKLGLEAGLAWARVCDYAVFYIDLGWSGGMKNARALYEAFEIEIKERSIEL